MSRVIEALLSVRDVLLIPYHGTWYRPELIQYRIQKKASR